MASDVGGFAKLVDQVRRFMQRVTEKGGDRAAMFSSISAMYGSARDAEAESYKQSAARTMDRSRSSGRDEAPMSAGCGTDSGTPRTLLGEALCSSGPSQHRR